MTAHLWLDYHALDGPTPGLDRLIAWSSDPGETREHHLNTLTEENTCLVSLHGIPI